MASHVPVWSETFRVRAYEVDATGRASVPALCNWLQESAGNHATSLGWGVEGLHARGLTWVLSRLHLRLAGRPGWRDDVVVSTWPAGVQRLYALREFRVAGPAGAELAVATTAWLLVSVSSLRPTRLPEELEEIARGTPGRALDDPFDKLPELSHPEFEVALDVRGADLDMNRHANNVSLIAAALEPLPESVGGGRLLAELEIEFRAEALHADRLRSQAQCVDGGEWRYLHRLAQERDGREIVRARSWWS